MTDDSAEMNSGGGSKALRNAAIIVLLLVVFTPLRWLALPIALVATLYGVVFVFRCAMRFNRRVGLGLVAIATTCSCIYVALLFVTEMRHRELLGKLERFGDITVRRNVFPLPYVHQLSIGHGVSDAELVSILRLEGLDRITDLNLDNDTLTDTGLRDAAELVNLGYIYIDCDNISDDAILQFEARFPECRVIPYKRNLHGEPKVFLRMPTDGE